MKKYSVTSVSLFRERYNMCSVYADWDILLSDISDDLLLDIEIGIFSFKKFFALTMRETSFYTYLKKEITKRGLTNE